MIDLKEIVESQMTAYKSAFEEGRKIGFKEGYRKAMQEIKEIIDKYNLLTKGDHPK